MKTTICIIICCFALPTITKAQAVLDRIIPDQSEVVLVAVVPYSDCKEPAGLYEVRETVKKKLCELVPADTTNPARPHVSINNKKINWELSKYYESNEFVLKRQTFDPTTDDCAVVQTYHLQTKRSGQPLAAVRP